MLIIPAIDILEGKAVRLKQGDFNQVTEFNSCPLSQALFWQAEGASLLHIVDLDGAKNGRACNQEIIFDLLTNVKIPIQIGGGIRNFKTAEAYLVKGAARVILGSSALDDLKLLQDLLESFGPERITVGLDLKNSQIAINGWQNYSTKNLQETLGELKKIGLEQIIVTDILKDGLEQGPNFDLIKYFSDFELIMSGGISSLADLEKIAAAKVKGAIVGKALYSKRLKISEINNYLYPKNPLAKRIIPCLDISDGLVVKGKNFTDLKAIGDPLKLARYYAKEQADELAILDISATVNKQENLLKTSNTICKCLNIPITVGGGVKTLSDIQALLKAGADKVCLGTAAAETPQIVAEAAQRFGSQAIVVSLDAKCSPKGDWLINIRSGTTDTCLKLLPFAKKLQKLGAGELLVNSIDRDGTKSGCDLRLLTNLKNEVQIPVIASSGLGSAKDFLEVFQIARADAALAAGVFHLGEIKIPDLKSYLLNFGLKIRC